MKLNFTKSGSAVPVIILHGLFGSIGNVRPIARALEADYPVYLLDLRNHGDSPHSDTMDFATMAEDVIEFMDDQKIPKAFFVGHSMGGKISMQIALNHPERVKKLIVADIAPVHYPHFHDSIIDGFYALMNGDITSRRQADEVMTEFAPIVAERSFLLKNLERNKDGSYGLKLNVKAIDENYGILREAPTGKPYTCPTLFIKGRDSAYIQAKHRDTILSLFPNVSLKIIENTGHWLHIDKSKVFNGIVKRFLAQDESVAAPEMPTIKAK